MVHVFEGQSANEVWQKAFIELSEGKHSTHQSGRGGATMELLHVAFAIKDQRQRWVVARQPPINPAFAIADVVWMLNGRHDSAVLSLWNRRLPEYAGHGEIFHGAYGFRLRCHFGFDQLERAYQVLKHKPESRQVALQIWDTKVDLPAETGEPVDADIPCNVLALLKVRQGKLEWTQINRSNDIFLGVPYNLIQFTVLQEVLAGWLGIGVGTYTHFSDSLHLYERNAPSVRADSTISVHPNTESIALPKDESLQVLGELNRRMERMTSLELSKGELQTLADISQLPQAYGNLLMVMVAETARRRGWADFMQENDLVISNLALAQVLERWHRRSEDIVLG